MTQSVKKQMEPGRYLASFDTMSLPHIFTDVLVLGSGVGGLRAAIEAAGHAEVMVVTKQLASESCSANAQGGVAVVLDSNDSIEAHVKDTLEVGCGLCNESAVRTIISEGIERVNELMTWGAKFDACDGKLLYTREGGHSRPRIVHARGDATGAELVATLIAEAQVHSRIHILEHTYAVDLLTRDGVCHGAIVHNATKGRMMVWSRQTILATGGAGKLFRETTNPSVITGDGLAMAYRAGANLMDLEFIQFHPTTLYIAGASRALISEAVRGEGGILLTKDGTRFMPNYHPDAELAPRDVVSRSIIQEMKRTGDTNVYLDLTHLGREVLEQRFPRIKALCGEFDIDIARDRIPVRPSAHYTVGGVASDLDGRTNIDGLLACGEVACTGFHGANRLGSNSLLEALVMGKRAGAAAIGSLRKSTKAGPYSMAYTVEKGRASAIDIADVEMSLRSLMWRQAGVERQEFGLITADERTDFWCKYVIEREFDRPVGWDLQNMLTLAKVIIHLARERTESRGCHYRSDFPKRDDVNWKRHSSLNRSSGEVKGV
ncbi:MAG TPA: L-aspartate oxidase [Planctomycetota bacterium]|nr:L-aspartate oxidase [Planctomycetota bacterium]